MLIENQLLPSPALGKFTKSAMSYHIERQLGLDNGFVEIGKFRWSAPVEELLHTDDDVFALNLALSPRPARTRIQQLGGPRETASEELGRVAILKPGRAFHLSAPSGKVRALYCGIARPKLEEMIGGPADPDGPNWQEQFKLRTPIFELLLNRVYEELCEDRFGSKLAIETYVRALCLELARCLRAAGIGEPPPRMGGLSPWRMRLLRERIHADAPAPSLTDLAELCGMTVRQLSRAFKEETGRTLGKFVDQATMERAGMLLMQSGQPISEIATSLGYATSASFAYAFRRSMGVLPSEFRTRSLS